MREMKEIKTRGNRNLSAREEEEEEGEAMKLDGDGDGDLDPFPPLDAPLKTQKRWIDRSDQ